MSKFNLQDFLAAPSEERVYCLRKCDLLEVVKHFNIQAVRTAMSKSDIRDEVLKHLAENELITLSDSVPPVKQDDLLAIRRMELEFQREEKEKERQLHLRLKEMDIDAQIRLKELELKSGVNVQNTSSFDVAKYVRLVPPFQEKEVDKYFLHFEKIANSLKWPVELWTMLLQSVLVGKAQEVYSALTLEQSSDYKLVKQAILKAYELVPEAYRQKFRNFQKFETQTHLEFARQKERLFDRWLRAQEVSDFAGLRDLILLEEFKSCVHVDVKTYLEEQQITDIGKAAALADEYALSHKISSCISYSRSETPPKNFDLPVSGNTCDLTEKKDVTSNNPEKMKSSKTCAYCKKRGHLISDCWTLARKNKKPVALTMAKPPNNFTLNNSDRISKVFEPFVMDGFISIDGDSKMPVKILRDTGASQTLLASDSISLTEASSTGTSVLLQGLEMDYTEVPLHRINLDCELVSGPVVVAVRPKLPIEGVSLILGNDLAGGKVKVNPLVVQSPKVIEEFDIKQLPNEYFPSCAVTRAMSKKIDVETGPEGRGADTDVNLERLFSDPEEGRHTHDKGEDISVNDFSDEMKFSKSELIKAQNEDEEVSSLAKQSISEEEALLNPVCFYVKSGVLMRKWRPLDVPIDEEWKTHHQIVTPHIYRQEILRLAHDNAMSGHLGVTKTYQRILKYFFWPGLMKDVKRHCRSCHVCQMIGKPNQKIPKAHLKPIPAFEEPFSRVLVDCVGPLPKTRSGNEFLLTIMCAATRFPEAFPLRRITAQAIIKVLIKFFTFVGLPKTIQSDQGSNFTSRIFKQVMNELNIKHIKSSAYHPESQGCLERFHQTMKFMIKAYCLEFARDWDEGINILLFAAREAVQESLGFSPFELVFGHNVRGPLKALQETLLDDLQETNLLNFVSTFRYRLHRSCEFAKQNLKSSQVKMKTWYDKKAKRREFSEGDLVLVLLPIPGDSLKAQYYGPCVIDKKIDNLNYIVKTPDRRKKTRLCHVNMLKEYHVAEEYDKNTPTTESDSVKQHKDTQHVAVVSVSTDGDVEKDNQKFQNFRLQNSDVLDNLECKLDHLLPEEQEELSSLLLEYSHLFSDTPGRTELVFHDVDVGDATPIKQHPYRVSPMKKEVIRKEIDYMLENNIIEPSQSAWSSPVLLVSKPDGSFRFCTDYRKLNLVTKTDSYPIPRLDDYIDKIGKAKYITKFDLLKGYWQGPLTTRAKEMSAFVTPDGLYQYTVMPFGMKNSAATFQRLINQTTQDIPNCDSYIDDIDIYSNTWDEHINQMRMLFDKLTMANLVINLVKSEFCKVYVQFLGHLVGHGRISPVTAKVEAIMKFPQPNSKRELMRFLGMASFYRRFCKNFSAVSAPLTKLLEKDQNYIWGDDQQEAFHKLKGLLMNTPVIAAPDFTKPFKLATDASDLAVGAVLLQEDESGIEHPVAYFSKKLTKSQRNYSTIEKETLALILALEHFEVYVNSANQPTTVYSDHNPIVFIHKMKNRNQRLLRWSLILQEYNLDIRHIPGKENVIADALSRCNN